MHFQEVGEGDDYGYVCICTKSIPTGGFTQLCSISPASNGIT